MRIRIRFWIQIPKPAEINRVYFQCGGGHSSAAAEEDPTGRRRVGRGQAARSQ
jgi:hypothetical protein